MAITERVSFRFANLTHYFMSREDPPHTDSMPTSVSLVARVQENDPQAWDRLVRLYSPLVYTWCRQHGLPSEDASDVLQEVFRAVHRTVGKFRRERKGDTFRGWLWTITRNKVRDHFRAVANRANAVGGTDAHMRFAELPEEEPPTDPSIAAGDGQSSPFYGALELVRAEFEDRTWQAFWKVTVEDKTTADVAETLGMSVNAVRLAKSRVLRRLRTELEGLID